MGIFSTVGNMFKNATNLVKNTNGWLSKGSSRFVDYIGSVGSNGANNVTNVAMKTATDTASDTYKAVDNVKRAYTTSAIKNENLFNQLANATADYKSQYAFNQSQSSAQKQMDFQKAQSDLAWERSQSSAQKQMDFQREMWQKSADYNTEMSNTAYQRMVKDLRVAGLNPILAVSQGGSSSPTMAVPSGSSSSAQAMSGASATFPVADNYKEDYGAISTDRDIDPLILLGSLVSSYLTSGLKNLLNDVTHFVNGKK